MQETKGGISSGSKGGWGEFKTFTSEEIEKEAQEKRAGTWRSSETEDKKIALITIIKRGKWKQIWHNLRVRWG